MPELAEVEFYRKQWDPGKNQKIRAVALHADKRIFRFTQPKQLRSKLIGKRLLDSEARGKQMLFRFSGNLWLGIHLGMTGKLWAASRDFAPDKHDHLVLFHNKGALVFSDMRQFGLVRFDQGAEPPKWWSSIAAALTSPDFTKRKMDRFLKAHGKLPIKASLLLQKGFPGVGNWMADEILWRAKLNPHLLSATLQPAQSEALFKAVRRVCREAIRRIGTGFSEPPPNWLFHQRWLREGHCPRDKEQLVRETICGRTSAWCPKCQPRKLSGLMPH